MIDTDSLLALAEFHCARCNRTGCDTFELMDQLEAMLNPGALTSVARRVDSPFLLRTVDRAALEQFRPVHGDCLRVTQPRRPGGPPYDLMKSVF
ncbi:MAG: hypothetical protein ACM3ML_25280 [Micromonosporaceae bacterium]